MYPTYPAFISLTFLYATHCLSTYTFHFIAYLTNPSENSFRAFLIEQSFRQHLTRLDVNADDENAAQDGSTSNHLSRRSSPAKTHALSLDNSPFHFANRASVSLRTPKHVFHSFGIFTIAAMAPLSRSSPSSDRDALIISDSWYIGAFGRWWRGGILDAWYQDIITRSNDEEGWTSGILSMKNLDLLNEYNGRSCFQLSLVNNLIRFVQDFPFQPRTFHLIYWLAVVLQSSETVNGRRRGLPSSRREVPHHPLCRSRFPSLFTQPGFPHLQPSIVHLCLPHSLSCNLPRCRLVVLSTRYI